MQLRAVALAALASGCSSAPTNPIWTYDVRPVLDANCIKCHGASARGGAPASFRLDRFDQSFDDLGFRIQGASVMSQFVYLRTHAKTMPPVAKLGAGAIETVQNWALDAAPRGEVDPNDAAPSIVLVASPTLDDDGFARVPYEIRDPDFDVVTGTLEAVPVGGGQAIPITSELYSGRGEARWDALAAAPGTYDLRATIDDGQRETQELLGGFEVPAGGDAAPTVSFVDFPPDPADPEAPPPDNTLRDRLISDADSPIDVVLELGDRDGDTLSVVLSAERGDESVEIASLADVAPGTQTIAFDTAGLGEGGNWWLRAQVDDGQLVRQAVAGPLVIGHGQSTVTFNGEIASLFTNFCITCHPAFVIHPLDIGDYATAVRYAGRIYRRVVQEETMPPRSLPLFAPGSAEMTLADRELLAEWILGGVPEAP